VIRAFRWQPNSDRAISAYLDRCAELKCLPNAVLIDAYQPGEFGGTGATADWGAIADWRDRSNFKLPLILAGGLHAKNVAEAIALVRPDAVDTASGVESSPGRKDAKRIADFARESRHSFTT
jgi:phosphoribosylanthranilate isomerase